MKTTNRRIAAVVLAAFLVSSAGADKLTLLTGVNVRHWPGSERAVTPVPGPGIDGTFYDGDRLAGTADDGPEIQFVGVGTPMFQPNEFGSLSFLFHRGSVPIPFTGQMPLMGVDYLGGPRLDLDGDLGNGVRSLVPVDGQTPVTMDGIESYLDLRFDIAGGIVELINVDATGSNEGGPGIQAETATVLLTLAGTENDGTRGPAINPDLDTRIGTLTPFNGSGQLAGVYRISNLGYEFWYDSIDPASGSADLLGTFQFLGTLNGYLVERDPATGQFPTLAGHGLGTTAWPAVADQYVGQTVNTAHGLAGGTATVAEGAPGDDFTAPGNGGQALADFGGDLGAYLDAVVVPLLPPSAERFVYLEGVGFGINNATDPIFSDTIDYDTVFVAADLTCTGDLDGDGQIGLSDLAALLASYGLDSADADYNSDADIDGDGVVGLSDLATLLSVYGTTCP